jgi:tRNA pseudouridine38-40 synthase
MTFIETSVALQRHAVVIRYSGENYNGWQTQTDGSAIQDHVENAFSKIADQPISVVCAGRTDAGVHAISQVCHADLPTSRPLTAWVRGVNGLLGSSVQIQSTHIVDQSFHARFSAVERCYRFVIYKNSVANPLLYKRAVLVFRPLNTDTMRKAAATLIGEHDFSSFRSSQCQARSPVRTINSIDFYEDGNLLVLQFRATAYLHHMIRNIMGALVEVGTSRQSLDWFSHMFNAKDRRLGAPTFPPEGLYFAGVAYPEESTPSSLRIACQPSALDKAQWW